MYTEMTNSPLLRIIIAFFILLLGITIYLYATGGNPSNIFLLLLGALVGPYMGLSYPFSITFKLLYVFGFVISFCLFVLGIKFNRKILGQVSVISGVVLWFFLGLIGLGTGT